MCAERGGSFEGNGECSPRLFTLWLLERGKRGPSSWDACGGGYDARGGAVTKETADADTGEKSWRRGEVMPPPRGVAVGEAKGLSAKAGVLGCLAGCLLLGVLPAARTWMRVGLITSNPMDSGGGWPDGGGSAS